MQVRASTRSSSAYKVIAALHELEENWNARKSHYPSYAGLSHPINLNVGRIAGGDWASSVPAWCALDVRVAIYPDQRIEDAKREIEDKIREASRRDSFLQNNPPIVTYNGFEAEGYVLKDAEEAVEVLSKAHKAVFGAALEQAPSTATTDARFFGLYGDMPALVYGPRTEFIHGFDERVDLASLRNVTKAITLFIADWCGVTSY